MPNRDKTGPLGEGPRTGRKAGNCNENTSTPKNAPRYEQGRGRGLGRGQGLGRGRDTINDSRLHLG